MHPEEVLMILGILAMVMAVPITAILTHHQRKMTAIVNAQRNRSMEPDVASRLSEEISELRQLVAQQAIVVDDLSMMHRRLLERSADDNSVRQRLGG